MNYQQIFDQAIGETPPSAVDVDRVVRRERRARRVRAAVAVVATAVAVLAVATTAMALSVTSESRPPAGPDLVFFPAHPPGTRIIAEVWGPLTEDQLTLTFTPNVPQTDLTFFIRCDADGTVAVELRLSEGTYSMRDCGERRVSPFDNWARFAVAGEETTVTLAISDDGPRPAGYYGLAVGEPGP